MLSFYKNFEKYFGFDPLAHKLFLSAKGAASSKNQRSIFRSLLMSYFIIKRERNRAINIKSILPNYV